MMRSKKTRVNASNNLLLSSLKVYKVFRNVSLSRQIVQFKDQGDSSKTILSLWNQSSLAAVSTQSLARTFHNASPKKD